MIVLVSNQFLLASKHTAQKHKPQGEPHTVQGQTWRDAPKKYFDFGQINGDFINLIQLKHYQRENKS